MERQRFHYGYALVLSLVLHVFLLGYFLIWGLPRWSAPLPREREIPQLQLIEPLEGPRFITTEEMPEREKPVPDSQFISDRNTQLRSLEKGSQEEMMPTQKGRDIPGLQLRDKPESQTVLTSPAPQEIPETPKNEEKNQQREEKEALLAKQSRYEAAKKAFLERSQSSPPSEPFSFRQDKTALQGAEVPFGETGVNAEATPLGRYKAKVFQLIGSQWRFMVRRQNSLLSYGTVKIRFWLKADGSVEQIEILGQTPGGELLKTLSENSIRLCAPYEKFSDIIEQQIGNRMMLEATFTIY